VLTKFVFSTMAEVEEPYEEPAYEEEAAEPEYAAEEEEFVAEGVATEVKLFGKWAFGDIEVRDISLVVSASNSFFCFPTKYGLCCLTRRHQYHHC
jgi:hypothetical protein